MQILQRMQRRQKVQRKKKCNDWKEYKSAKYAYIEKHAKKANNAMRTKIDIYEKKCKDCN